MWISKLKVENLLKVAKSLKKRGEKMWWSILEKDFKRKKAVTGALFIFIMLSALLAASGTNIVTQLMGSMNELFKSAHVADFIQMHAGELNQAEIDSFTQNNPQVKSQQSLEMLNINGKNLYLGNSEESEKDSVMDISLLTQSSKFDFLLDLNNQLLDVPKSGIAVPIYYMEEKNMKIGDNVKIAKGDFEKDFVVTDFVRDAQMNPAMVSSKRFVVNPADYEILKAHLSEKEYLIEFQLNDPGKLDEFRTAYADKNLPNKGPTIDVTILRLMNALSDGIVALVIVLVSMLLVLISFLCLRFTFLETMEEDYKEIGVMKAIGLSEKTIKKTYLVKYVAMAGAGAIVGYGLSFLLSSSFTKNIMLYLGEGPKSLGQYVYPLAAVLMIFFLVVLFCKRILKRFDNISAVEALQAGSLGERKKRRKTFLKLEHSRYLETNIFLGLKDILSRTKIYGLVIFIFAMAAFLVIVPLKIMTTMASPNFVSYMGVGKSDIRIDLQQTDHMAERFREIQEIVSKDTSVDKYVPLVTCKYKVLGNDEVWESINIESGDFSVFPLDYMDGRAPKSENEIALSYLNASQNALNKKVGDKLWIKVRDKEQEMVVVGIYQDITNGGKTAKALLPADEDTALWYVINVKLKENVDISAKIKEYGNLFSPAKIFYLEDYLKQTLGGMLGQLRLVTIMDVGVAGFMAVLITCLFLKMMMAKDAEEIAVLRSLGFSDTHIRVQYMTRMLVVLVLGIVIGTLIANTLGESLVGLMLGMLGAVKIKLESEVLTQYILCSLGLMAVVAFTSVLSLAKMKDASIAKMMEE